VANVYSLNGLQAATAYFNEALVKYGRSREASDQSAQAAGRARIEYVGQFVDNVHSSQHGVYGMSAWLTLTQSIVPDTNRLRASCRDALRQWVEASGADDVLDHPDDEPYELRFIVPKICYAYQAMMAVGVRMRVEFCSGSVAGRFIFTPLDSDREHSVEQVWRCSPRLLEQVSRHLPFPYLRASRYSWGWPFTIEGVQIPRHWPLDDPPTLVSEFFESMRLFERQRDSIEVFLAFLNSFGFRAYSLEYKIVGAKLNIIDWDTPDDRLVLASVGK
jgi:hypothetical protein